MSSAKKGLVAGAVSLGVAGLISKILGVAYQMPFQNLAGDYTVGLYQYAYVIYVIMLYVTTAGIPLAMSKLISERNALRDYAGADQLYSVGARYLSAAGLAAFALTFLLGGVLAVGMGDYNASTAIRALSFALLFVPLLAAMRGYLQGHQRMAASGNSQVIEQLVRSLFIIFGVLVAVQFELSPRTIAAVATFSALIGAFASLVFIARHVVRIRRENRKKFAKPATEEPKLVFRKILKVAIPISLSSLVLPLSQLVDGFTVTNMLTADFGLNLPSEAASAEYGIFTGRALKLVALPLALATAVGLSLMPAISEAIAARNTKESSERIKMAFRLTGFFAFPTSIGIFVLAKPIDITIFQDIKGWETIAMVSFMSIFSSYELVTTYILQACGFMYRPIRNMAAGLIVKLVLNLALIPFFGIMGAAAASVIGYLFSSMLNFHSVKKLAKVPLSTRQILAKPLLASLVMGAAVWVVTLLPVAWIPWPRIGSLLIVLTGGAVGAVVFFALMILFKGVSKAEMQRMPVIKRFVR